MCRSLRFIRFSQASWSKQGKSAQYTHLDSLTVEEDTDCEAPCEPVNLGTAGRVTQSRRWGEHFTHTWTKRYWRAKNMARHHPDLIMCRKLPGIAIGRLCEKCASQSQHIPTNLIFSFLIGDGRCVVCDSFVRPATLVRICDECNYGTNQGRCVICGGPGIADAYYCKGCTTTEKDRDGCPKIINLGSAKTDLFYERKKYGFRKW